MKNLFKNGELKYAYAQPGVYAAQRPPMAPSAFETELKSLKFTNGADREVVGGLYRRTMVEGFAALTELLYPKVGWGDAEAAELSATLREVPCRSVLELKLSFNRFVKADLLAAVLRQLVQQPAIGGVARHRCLV